MNCECCDHMIGGINDNGDIKLMIEILCDRNNN